MGIEFCYWAPLEKNGLLATTLPQRTGSSFADNVRYAAIAERCGFGSVLLPTRFIASSDGEDQWESLTIASALATQTKSLRLIAAVASGLWPPAIVAKILTTIDHLSGGRAAVNVVSGWLKDEYVALGEPWLDHDERYRRSEEFIRVLRALWTEEQANFAGDFYRLRKAEFRPRPLQQPGPPVYQGGNSKAARRMAGRVSDFYLMNGNTVENLRKQIEEVRKYAAENGREVRFGVNAFVIVRDTEAEARQQLRDIIDYADAATVEAFRRQVLHAGKAAPEREGMWADSTFEDLIQFNDGFKTGLIGTAEQVAERITELQEIGMDLLLAGFLHYDDELERFGQEVIPLVRQREKAYSF
ncbi:MULTISPECIES: dimethylsulfone monooxygenase SfnG [Cohnella]|jgi:FMNH2-dependent dimethyl sulfone monooxygenase|uniref:dimethylsulfone monooxygenase SfnG n=1 Tax=Cohnella TaxID=329857 RepID=UPI000E39A9EB|nr:dimethyl sulfone monooxygenase SfnG [Cohnella sp.]REK60878.1 MAG: dimethyl sulfone monooxygenase SfnG [Cohnella sp.]